MLQLADNTGIEGIDMGAESEKQADKHSDKQADKRAEKSVNLGRCGSVKLLLAGDRKRLLIAFEVDARGFDKSGLNGFIDALKKVRDKMER